MTKMHAGRIAVVALVLAAPATSLAQDGGFEPPRTKWGDPDLRGHYLPGPYQALETPTSEWAPPEGANQGQGAAFSRFFEPDPDAPARPTPARPDGPMIIDPPSGQVPFQPWATEQRNEIMARQDQLEHLDPRVKCLPAAFPRAHLPVGPDRAGARVRADALRVEPSLSLHPARRQPAH